MKSSLLAVPLLLFGLGMAAGGSRRGGASGEAAARRALSASDATARAPGFYNARDARGASLTGQPTTAGLEVGALPRGAQLNRARRMAGQLTKALRAAEPSEFARDDVRAFQTAAGLDPSGLYETSTRDMLAHLGIKNPPAAWFTR